MMVLLGEMHLRLRTLLCSNPALKSPVRWLSAAARPRALREEQEAVEQEQEMAVSRTFTNRNPRNLEQMSLAVKDRGWATTWPHREFYHRLVFSRSQHHVTAEVIPGGAGAAAGPVISCSTKEWALKQELGSTHCVAACQAVGEVLAQRCQQAGITRMVYRSIPWMYRSDAVQAFRKAMKEGGVTLSEPRRKYVGT